MSYNKMNDGSYVRRTLTMEERASRQKYLDSFHERMSTLQKIHKECMLGPVDSPAPIDVPRRAT